MATTIERKLFRTYNDADDYVKEEIEKGRKLISYSVVKGGLFDLSCRNFYNKKATIVWDDTSKI